VSNIVRNYERKVNRGQSRLKFCDRTFYIIGNTYVYRVSGENSNLLSPLSANVVHVRVAPRQRNSSEMASVFLKKGQICYKMLYCTLCLGSAKIVKKHDDLKVKKVGVSVVDCCYFAKKGFS